MIRSSISDFLADHIPLKQGLRLLSHSQSGHCSQARRPYSIKTRIYVGWHPTRSVCPADHNIAQIRIGQTSCGSQRELCASGATHKGRGQDVELSTGHRRYRGSTCGYQAGIPIGILHLRQRERYTEICCLPMARHGAGTTHSRISGG